MDFLFTPAVRLAFLLALISAMVNIGISDTDKDREECAEQLVGLATCLPYVGGDAKAPTPDCCSGLKQVLKNNKKCLCVIIKDRNDPELGLKINVTLALSLPSVCHASANISQCPTLLHLAPNSTDAQVFYQFANNSSQSASSPAISPSGVNNLGTNSSSKGTSADQKSSGCYNGIRWFGVEIFSFGSLLFIYSSLFI